MGNFARCRATAPERRFRPLPDRSPMAESGGKDTPGHCAPGDKGITRRSYGLDVRPRRIAEGRLDERLGFFAKPKLLIIDELGTCRSPRICFANWCRGAMSAAQYRLPATVRSVSGAACLATRWWRPPSSIGCCTVATNHHPRRQLSATREEPLQGGSRRRGGGRVSPPDYRKWTTEITKCAADGPRQARILAKFLQHAILTRDPVSRIYRKPVRLKMPVMSPAAPLRRGIQCSRSLTAIPVSCTRSQSGL
jgi:hypothetical protein